MPTHVRAIGAVQGGRPPERFLVTAVASDLLALHAIAALTAATGSATAANAALSFVFLLSMVGEGDAMPEAKEELERAHKDPCRPRLVEDPGGNPERAAQPLARAGG